MKNIFPIIRLTILMVALTLVHFSAKSQSVENGLNLSYNEFARLFNGKRIEVNRDNNGTVTMATIDEWNQRSVYFFLDGKTVYAIVMPISVERQNQLLNLYNTSYERCRHPFVPTCSLPYFLLFPLNTEDDQSYRIWTNNNKKISISMVRIKDFELFVFTYAYNCECKML